MNIIPFGEGCDRIRRYVDSYLSGELLAETRNEVQRHLENCPSCASEVDARSRLKAHLKTAVLSQQVPAELAVNIREQLRQPQSAKSATWTRWAMAAAAAIVLSVGIWAVRNDNAMPDMADRRGQDVFIQKVSQIVAVALQPGLKDHIHCSVFRKYPANPPTLEQMTKSMGPAYQGLVPIVKAAIPDNYRIIMAHQCGYAGRRYVHLTMRDGAKLISLVIARKEPGESLQNQSPTKLASGVALYQAAAQNYEVAGFETEQFLAYVVSDLNAKSNLQVASNLAPSVRDFLVKAQS